MTSFPYQLSDEEWRAKLTPQQYTVLRREGTEAYGAGEFCSYFPKTGHFVCRGCEAPLYSAASKFQDAGWDAYSQCYHTAGRPHVCVRSSQGEVRRGLLAQRSRRHTAARGPTAARLARRSAATTADRTSATSSVTTRRRASANESTRSASSSWAQSRPSRDLPRRPSAPSRAARKTSRRRAKQTVRAPVAEGPRGSRTPAPHRPIWPQTAMASSRRPRRRLAPAADPPPMPSSI